MPRLPLASQYSSLSLCCVKASARFPREAFFSRSNHPSALKIATPPATLPGADWLARWWGEIESLIWSFYLSVAGPTLVSADLSLRYTNMTVAETLNNQQTTTLSRHQLSAHTSVVRVCCFLGCLNDPAICQCISWTDLLRQVYVLPHRDRSCRSDLPHPVKVY